MDTKGLVKQALVATVYVVLTIIWEPKSYGLVQFRISEVLMLLMFFDKRYGYGLTLGVFISNLFSFMPLDIIIGTFATACSVYAMSETKNKYLALLSPAIFNGLIIGWQLYFFADFPLIISMVSVFFGEFVVVFIPGILFLDAMLKNDTINRIFS